jgi:hypothetical protein
MKQLTPNGIKNYLIRNYGEVKHDCQKLRESCHIISKRYGCKSIEVFHFMIEQDPIPSLRTHSYGYNTRLGRQIREEFQNEYYSI